MAIAENKIQLREEGVIPKLVKLLAPEHSASIREYSAATLWNLARDDDNKRIIREEGGLLALVGMLSDPSEILQENAAGSLLTLTLNAENRDFVRVMNGLSALAALLDSKVEIILEYAVGALKNCAANR